MAGGGEMRRALRRASGFAQWHGGIAACCAWVLGALLLAPSTAFGGAGARLGRIVRAHASVVGGAPAPAGSFPWMAWIGMRAGLEFDQCTGTVLAPYLVLTAAHCAVSEITGAANDAASYLVGTGSNAVTSPEMHMSRVSEVIVNPAYDSSANTGDAALLVLSTPSPAPAIAIAAEPPAGEERVQIAGWGLTGADQTEPPRDVHGGEVSTLSQAECERNWPGFDAQSEICVADTQSESQTICAGDSGGPLVARSPSGPVEIGVADLGTAGCRADYPAVYARTDALSGWIHEAEAALQPIAQPSAVASSPVPGVYTTVRSAAHSVTFRIASDGSHLTHLTAQVRVSCEHGYYLDDSLTAYFRESAPLGSSYLRENFVLAATKRFSSEHDGLYLHVSAAGLVEGRLMIRVRERGRAGLCYAPAVRFWAYRARG